METFSQPSEDCILRVTRDHGQQVRMTSISGFKSIYVLRQMSLLCQPKGGTERTTSGWHSTSYNTARTDFRFRFIKSMEKIQTRWEQSCRSYCSRLAFVIRPNKSRNTERGKSSASVRTRVKCRGRTNQQNKLCLKASQLYRLLWLNTSHLQKNLYH